ncbi:hypothetical protein AWC11_27315 [Mycobacterium interjectum]|nr:hypothetical protein AWC11_27315 [Mycobacterium interjectum]
MGITGDWKPRFRVTAALVIAHDQQGRLRHCYRDSLLGWLSDEQAAHFVTHNLVERIEESPDVPTMPAAETVANCVVALDNLGIRVAAGDPTARQALRDAGHRFANDVVAAAVKQRKASKPDLDEEFDEITM